jgi:DNA-binding transcriptional LysR family regulator
MSAESLLALDSTARPLTAAQIAAARRAWAAFTAETPERLATIAAEPSCLAFLPAALRRLLAELPHVDSGLSLTEERILEALDVEASTIGLLFKTTSEQEEARFLGDAPFFRRVDVLAFSPTPLVAGVPFSSSRCRGGPKNPDYDVFARSKIALTDAGRAALAGRFDHALENHIDRWLGGLHLTPHDLWRRSRDGVVPPTH